MVNDCIGIGIANNITSLKALSLKAYHKLEYYKVPSYYKLCAISRASGILASRKKSMRRGVPTKSPYAVKQHLTSCYGFKLEGNSILRVATGNREFLKIPLNRHTQEVLSDPALRVRSFTLTASVLSICISKEVQEVECTGTAGVDRNLRNITYGNDSNIKQYDISKCPKIAKMTKEVIASFKRKDVRIRKKIASKYGVRRHNKINQILHRVTKDIVEIAFGNGEAIVLEDITGIRRLYRKGNSQGRRYRGLMNSWPFGEIQKQIEYKSRWIGVPIIRLSKGETRGTSTVCPRCGERLQFGQNGSRQLWRPSCKVWEDRDVVAAKNLSRRGLLRFGSSLPLAKGGAVEAMRGNPLQMEVIPGVDAPKSSLHVKTTEPEILISRRVCTLILFGADVAVWDNPCQLGISVA